MDEADRKDFRFVAFSHLDTDHTCGARYFFRFDHATLLQGSDRPKIGEMWVPAEAITETNLAGDAWTIRAEARHRLTAGYGIKVFSRPGKLAKYLAKWDLTVEDRRDCIVNAGELVDSLSLTADGVEFFAHSPEIVAAHPIILALHRGDSFPS